jgi:hypothetical protein
VLKIVQRRGFAAEQRERRIVSGEFGKQYLDGDRVAGLNRVPLVDLTHPAGCDQVIDLIDAVEPRAGRKPVPRCLE